MKIKKTIAKAGGVLSSLYLSTGAVLAAPSASSYITSVSSAGETDLVAFIRSALNLAIALTALIAVGFLVFSGIQYITAAGDDTKIEKATTGITYSVIGLIIAFISVLIVNFVLTELLGAS